MIGHNLGYRPTVFYAADSGAGSGGGLTLDDEIIGGSMEPAFGEVLTRRDHRARAAVFQSLRARTAAPRSPTDPAFGSGNYELPRPVPGPNV